MAFFVPILLVLILGGTNVYLAHRVWRWVHHFAPKLPFWVLLIFFLGMTAVMFLSVARPFDGWLQRAVSAVGTCWMGAFAYLTLCFLAADAVTLLGWLLRLVGLVPQDALERLRLGAGMAATALALSLCVYGVCHAQRLYTKEYQVTLSETPQSRMNVVFISDVHLGAVGSEARLERIVERINALEPDLVCIGGDFFDNDFSTIADPEKALQTMQKLKAPYGVYACLGNHDAGKTFRAMEDFFAQAGVKLLKDEYILIDGRLILAGRLDPSPIGGAEGLRRGELSQVLDGADLSFPVVVLDHNPISVDTYPGQVDLVLSGHTHKGQIFPGELVTDAMYTVDYGYYRAPSGTQAIVTSGVGIWGLPMRVGTNCEILWIQLNY